MGPMLQVPMLPLNQQPTLQMYCESVSATTVEIKDFFSVRTYIWLELISGHRLKSEFFSFWWDLSGLFDDRVFCVQSIWEGICPR